MIEIPDDVYKPVNFSELFFCGSIEYDFLSRTPFSFQRKHKPVLKPFKNKIFPNNKIFNLICDNFYNDNTFFFSLNGVCMVFGDINYKFGYQGSVQKHRFLDDQIFLKTEKNILSATNNFLQSMDKECIDFDVIKATRELVFLEDDAIRIYDGNHVDLKSNNMAKRIVATEHPREFVLLSDYNAYLIDFRMKKIARRLLENTYIIKDVYYANNKLVVNTGLHLHVLKNLVHDDRFVVSLNGNYSSMYVTSKEIIARDYKDWLFINIDNLYENSTIEYSINCISGFAANDNYYYFFLKDGVLKVDHNGTQEFINKNLIYPKNLFKTRTSFFDELNFEDQYFQEYDFLKKEDPVNSTVFNEYQNKIQDHLEDKLSDNNAAKTIISQQINENISQKEPQNLKTKRSRKSGF